MTMPDGDPFEIRPTDKGRAFYVEHGLAEWPQDRANHWSTHSKFKDRVAAACDAVIALADALP